MSYYQIQDFRKYLTHPEKYTNVSGQPCTLRSGWEIRFATWLDTNSGVLKWSSEEIVIKYDFMNPKTGKLNKHRYFTDFWMQIRDKQGDIKEYIIEIKPFKETMPPQKPKRETKAYKNRIVTYLKNQAKWNAAREFCANQKRLGKEIEFVVLTEKDLPIT